MSKFDDLCREYAESRQRYFAYRDECHDVAGALIDGLIQYLGCPQEGISFHLPEDAEEKPGTFYSLMSAMNMQEDAFWHFTVGILVFEAPNISPKHRNLFDLALKKKDGQFEVKITAGGKSFWIDPKDAKSAAPVYDEIFRLMDTHYKTGLERVLEKDDQVRKIGFGPSEDDLKG